MKTRERAEGRRRAQTFSLLRRVRRTRSATHHHPSRLLGSDDFSTVRSLT